jgi:hypothetical protein
MKMISYSLLKDLGFTSITGYDHVVWHCENPEFYVHYSDELIDKGYLNRYTSNGSLDSQKHFLEKFINRVQIETIREAARRALDCTNNDVVVDWNIEDI